MQLSVDLLPTAQEVIEAALSEHGAQSGLRDLRGRFHEVRNANDGSLSIRDLKEDDGVNLHRDVVGGDHLLLSHFERDYPQVDFPQVIDPEREYEEQPWTLEWDQPAEPKDDASLVFSGDLDGRRDDTECEECDESDWDQ